MEIYPLNFSNKAFFCNFGLRFTILRYLYGTLKKTLIYKITGSLGAFGCFAVMASDIIGILLHEKHNPISDTISMLAIGRYGWIQDYGLDIFALGYLAIAIGLFTWKRRGYKWIISLLILALIGVDLIMIAEHNQYAGRPGEKIHMKLVYTLAGLFLLLNILIGFDLKKLKSYLKPLSFWVAGLWLLSAPWLPFIPDNLDGAYERFICTLLVLWPGVVSYHLFNLSRK